MSENIQKSPLPCGGGLGVGETQSIKQGYKQTSLGILPQEWEVVRLGEVCEINPNSKKLPHEFYYIDLESVKNGKLLYKNKICKDKAPSRAQRILAKQDILFQLVRPYQRNNLFFDLDDICVASTGYAQIRTNENPFFIFQYLHTTNFVSQVLEHCTGSNYPAINSSDLSNLQIPLPPLAEQEKIAQILGVWDKGISVLKSLIEAKTKHKKALMQRLLTPPTHPLTPSAREGEQKSHHDTKAPPLAGGVGVGYSHIENNRNDDKVLDCHDLTASNLAMTEKNSKSLRFAEFTDKWQEFRLGDILQEKNIRNANNVILVLSVTNKQGFVAQKDYFEQEVASSDTGNYKVVCNGEFAYNPARINVGSIAMLENFEIGILSPMYVVFECLEKIDKNFFKHWLESYNFKGILRRYLSGSVRETLSFTDMKTMQIFLPTLTEQKKIAQVLSACDKEIELLKSKFQCLKTQKKGLMQRLLNGEVRVKY